MELVSLSNLQATRADQNLARPRCAWTRQGTNAESEKAELVQDTRAGENSAMETSRYHFGAAQQIRCLAFVVLW
jgi:hypothetical protein